MLNLKGGESMEELKTRVSFMGTATFSNFKATSNPSFHKATLRIMAIDKIAKKYKFTEKSVESAIGSIDNVPLATYFDERSNNLGDHDEQMKDGRRTYGVGTIAESCKKWIEEVEDNGIVDKYLSSEVILWKRQEKEYDFIRRHKELSVSMEVQPTKAYRTKDGIIVVEDFYFTAVTILGIGINPAFGGASITFSQQDEQYQQMMTELKEFENGGFSMEDNQNVNEPINPTSEPTEPTEPVSEPTEPVEPQSQEGTKTEPEGESAKVDYKAQMEQMEVEYSKTIRDLTQEKDTLSQQIQTLTSEKSSLEEELNSLREYKNTIEKEQRTNAQNEVLERYADLKDYEGYDDLMTRLDTMSADELESNLIILFGRAERAKREKQRGNKPTQAKLNITTANNQQVAQVNPRYGII